MAEYRVQVQGGGFNGYWVAQRRTWWGWLKIAEFSIYSYGNEAAKNEALLVIKDAKELEKLRF